VAFLDVVRFFHLKSKKKPADVISKMTRRTAASRDGKWDYS